MLTKPGSPELSKTTTGFALGPGKSKTVSVPTEWSGILFGRTLCSTSSDGKFSCVTGDCGSGTVECGGGAGSLSPPPPTTLAYFTPISGADGQYVSYYVSLWNGYNLPMAVVPIGGSGSYCRATDCVMNLNIDCPEQLRVMYGNDGVGCNYCSTSTGATFSNCFEKSCPQAHTSANDMSSTFGCLSVVNYDVTFCASSSNSTDGYEKQNHELNKKPIPTSLILKYLGGSTGMVILVVAMYTFAFKLVIRYRSRTSDIQFGLSMGTSSSARNVEEAISSS